MTDSADKAGDDSAGQACGERLHPRLARLQAAIEAEIERGYDRIRARYPGALGELLVEIERETAALVGECAMFGRLLTPEERAEYRGGGSA